MGVAFESLWDLTLLTETVFRFPPRSHESGTVVPG